MQPSIYCIEMIKNFESLRLEAYICPAGKTTIGYGHLIAPWENYKKITKQQALKILEIDVSVIAARIKKFITTPLNQYQFDSLVSLAYNIGTNAFIKSKLLQYVNQRKYKKAADEFDKWIYANGKKLNGLKKRRSIEKIVFQTY